MKITTERRRRSEALTRDEHKSLLKYIGTFPTLIDAAFAIGIPRQTLERVKIIGSGSPETIHSIREKLNSNEPARA
jgi:hypothetical protein